MRAKLNPIYTPWILFVTLAFSVTLVSGCQNYGGKPETPNESFALAATLIETGYDIIRLGVQSQDITRAKGIELRNQVVEAENALRIAETSYQAGRSYNANVFSSVRAVLSTVRAAAR